MLQRQSALGHVMMRLKAGGRRGDHAGRAIPIGRRGVGHGGAVGCSIRDPRRRRGAEFLLGRRPNNSTDRALPCGGLGGTARVLDRPIDHRTSLQLHVFSY